MKRFFSLKSLSRTVHANQEDHDGRRNDGDNGLEEASSDATCLTVWKKSLVISCNGFTVIDAHGDLAYRVDNYTGRPKEIVLMDASGGSVLTMCRRKKLGLVDNWFVYEGEFSLLSSSSSSSSRSKPIFIIKKNINLMISNAKPPVLAHIYRATSAKRCAYTIEGSYSRRSCKVVDDRSKRVVAETRRKREIVGGVSYGVEVFQLIVHPGFDPGFAMALVLLLDQMFS